MFVVNHVAHNKNNSERIMWATLNSLMIAYMMSGHHVQGQLLTMIQGLFTLRSVVVVIVVYFFFIQFHGERHNK